MTLSQGRFSRRDLGRLAMGAAALAGARSAFGAKKELTPWGPGIKISLQIPNDFDDEYLTFAKQMGVGYVSIPTKGGTYEIFAEFKRRVEAAGLKVANIGNSDVHNMPEVTLNLPGRNGIDDCGRSTQCGRGIGNQGMDSAEEALHTRDASAVPGSALVPGSEIHQV